jgi:TRAP-type C4-dicarboxylate transport system permease small subunit
MKAHQTDAEAMPKDPAPGAIPRVLRLLSLAEDAVLVVLLAAMILIAAAQILLRNFLDMGLAWGDQALRVMVLWLGLVGAVAASRDNKHINIEVLLRFMPQPAKVVSQAVVALFTVFVCAVIAFYACRFVYLDYRMGTLAFGNLPAWVVEIILPVGFSLIALRYCCLAADQLKNSGTKEGGR